MASWTSGSAYGFEWSKSAPQSLSWSVSVIVSLVVVPPAFVVDVGSFAFVVLVFCFCRVHREQHEPKQAKSHHKSDQIGIKEIPTLSVTPPFGMSIPAS